MHIPDWFQRRLSDFRGRSIYGDPVLRVVWGADERDWKGSYKYIWPEGGVMNCWVLERWQPAGFFGLKEAWNKRGRFYDDIHEKWVDLNGPFPERGAYTMICPLLENDGSPAKLDETTLTAIRRKVLDDEGFAELQGIERDFLVAAQHEQRDATRRSVADKRQEDIREYHLKNWDKINRSVTRGYSTTPR